MPSKKILLLSLITLTIFGCTSGIPTQLVQKTVNPSITVQEIKIQDKDFLIAKIDPTYFQFHIIQNAPAPDSQTIDQIRQSDNAILAFNGSFFDEKFRPLGLLISQGRSLFPLTKSELMNGVFTIDQNNNPALYTYEDFRKRQTELLPNIDFAIQAGPILLDDQGQIVIDQQNQKKSSRTALAIDQDDDIILIMLRQGLLDQSNALTLHDFTSILSTSNELSSLGLHSIINLDGGKSSGLATETQYLPEISKVENIITISKRS